MAYPFNSIQAGIWCQVSLTKPGQEGLNNRFCVKSNSVMNSANSWDNSIMLREYRTAGEVGRSDEDARVKLILEWDHQV